MAHACRRSSARAASAATMSAFSLPFHSMSTADANDPLVRVADVSKNFRRGSEEIHVLSSLDLEVQRGEFLALMGPSGSGKSTLLNLIGGLDRPSRGTVRIAQDQVDKLSDRQLAAWRAARRGFILDFYSPSPALRRAEYG